MTSINKDRTRYPINEPVFPHWSNMGAVLDEEMAEDQAKREREGNTAYVPRSVSYTHLTLPTTPYV